MTRRLTARGRERRRQLMEFAAGRFAANGYHPTSVADIVSGLNVGKGVFYWYFESKEELLVEILADAQRDLRRRQQQAIGDEPDPVRRIEAGIRASVDWLASNRQLFSLLQFAASDERFRPHLHHGQEVAAADVARHVTDGIASGAFRDGDPLVLSHAIIGVTDHLVRTFLFERGTAASAVADEAVAFCLSGLLGADPTGRRPRPALAVRGG